MPAPSAGYKYYARLLHYFSSRTIQSSKSDHPFHPLRDTRQGRRKSRNLDPTFISYFPDLFIIPTPHHLLNRARVFAQRPERHSPPPLRFSISIRGPRFRTPPFQLPPPPQPSQKADRSVLLSRSTYPPSPLRGKRRLATRSPVSLDAAQLISTG